MKFRKYLSLIIFNKTAAFAGLCFLMIFSKDVLAQDKKKWNERGEIEDTQIIIEKDKKIVLPEAVRNFEKVPVQPKNQVRQIEPYKFDDFEVSLADIETKMRVLTAKQDELKKLYGNYLKGGYGSYGTSYLEGFFNNKRNEKVSYGARVKHLASRFGHIDQENSGNSDNEAGIFGKAYTDYVVLSGAVDYNRERYNFYGYPRVLDPKPDNDDIKHLIQSFGGKVEIENNLKDAALDYHITAQASTIFNNYNVRENEFGAKVSGEYTLATSSRILANIEAYLTKVEDEYSFNRNFFKINPYYQFNYKGFLLKLGGNIIYENDSVRTTKFHIFPSAEGSYQFFPEITAYAGVEGDVQRTSLKGFLSENPFLAPNADLLHTQKIIDIYGGFKGKVLTNLAYNLKVSAADYKNLYFYKNNVSDPSKFDIVYDNITAVFSYLAELSYTHSEKLNLGLKLEGFGYNLQNLEQHYHRPNYTGTFIGRYDIKQKISITSELFYINGLIAADEYEGGDITELDDIVDLNIKLDYRFSPKFSAFVHGNNLLGKNYQRYLYYPSRGFNILAGLTFSF